MIDHALRFNIDSAGEKMAHLATVIGLSDQSAEGFLAWLVALKRGVGVAADLFEHGLDPGLTDELSSVWLWLIRAMPTTRRQSPKPTSWKCSTGPSHEPAADRIEFVLRPRGSEAQALHQQDVALCGAVDDRVGGRRWGDRVSDSPPLLRAVRRSITGSRISTDSVLHGGSDVAPTSYACDNPDDRWPGDPIRDAYELICTDGSARPANPVLGICRGMQVMNVAHGGTLHQDLICAGTTEQQHRDAESV